MRTVGMLQLTLILIAACSMPRSQGPVESKEALSTERSVAARFTDEVASDGGNVVEVVLIGFTEGTHVLWETTAVSGMQPRSENLRFTVDGTRTIIRPGALPIMSNYVLTLLIGDTRYSVPLAGVVVTVTSSPSPAATAIPTEAPPAAAPPTAARSTSTPVQSTPGQRTATADIVTARVDPQQVRLGDLVTFSFVGVPSGSAVTWLSHTSPGGVTKPALDMLYRPYAFTGTLTLRMEPPGFSVGIWTFRFAWAGQNYDLRVTVLQR